MQLNIGDKIYKENYNKITGVFTVKRLTKTLAICGNGVKFKREYNSWLKPIGDNVRFTTSHYLLETPELKEKLYRQYSISKIRDCKLEDLSTEQIRSIMDVLTKTAI